MANKTYLLISLVIGFLAGTASAQEAEPWNGSAETAQSVPSGYRSGSAMGDNTNLMISFYPEIGGLSSQGPLVGQGYSFTGGFGGSIQLTHSYFGAEFDLGYNFLNQGASYCSALIGCVDYSIISPAILLDFIANPYSSGPAYVYAMVGEGFNTLYTTDGANDTYPSVHSNGPILGLGLMLVRPDSHFFGDFELRYTDWGNFGATGYSSVSNVAFLVKIGVRIGPTSAPGQSMGRRRKAAYYDEQPQPQGQQAPAQEPQQAPPDQGGGLY